MGKLSVAKVLRHIFKITPASRFHPEKYRKVVDTVLQNNAYFAHAENTLLPMLSDESEVIRQVCLLRLLKARGLEKDDQKCFKMSKLVMEADVYHLMIDWQGTQLSEPPLPKDYLQIKCWRN